MSFLVKAWQGAWLSNFNKRPLTTSFEKLLLSEELGQPQNAHFRKAKLIFPKLLRPHS